MRIKQLVVGPLGTNCFVVLDDPSGRAAVVDPGANAQRVVEALEGYTASYILVTHAHFDHIGGVGDVKAATGAPVAIHRLEAEWLSDPVRNGSGLWPDVCPEPVVAPPPDRTLEDGDRLPFGDREIVTLFTPGHSPGHVAYLLGNVVFAGDTLFQGSIGRSDIPGGDHGVLLRSIREKLLVLGDDTIVAPGHGPATTIGREKLANPFLRDR